MNEGRTHWKSLEERADTPEFRRHLEKEFPSSLERVTDSVSRRSFLGLMGAAVAMSGLVGCRRPLAKILPYARMPEDVLPGVPRLYATMLPFRGVAEGVLVTSHEGRPTKIEGNPSHPSSLGATHLFAQASVLELYDPDRSKFPVQQGRRRSWAEFADWGRGHFRALRENGGAGLRVLSESTSSPSQAALRAELLRAFPRAAWHGYEPVNRDEVLEGARIAFGRPARTQLALDQADVIVTLDSDFLFAESNSVRHARDFASRRRVSSAQDSMNRLYAVEASFTATGTMADHRLRASRAQTAAVAAALVAALANLGVNLGALSTGAEDRAGLPEGAEKFVRAMAGDLVAHRGRGAVLVGSAQPAEMHALAHALNAALGNVGTVIRYTEEPETPAQTASLRELAGAMGRGEVDTLLVLGGNPAYTAPGALDFAGKLKQVPHVVRLGLHEDETSRDAEWHLPATHYLEAWGDGRAWDGTRGVQQPLIAPLYEGRSDLELVALVLERPHQDGHALVRELGGVSRTAGEEDPRWRRALHDGHVEGSAFAETPVRPDVGSVARSWAQRERPEVPGADRLELQFPPDSCMWDGRHANNGWLQELPENMTKLTWDNAARISPRTAGELGLATEDLAVLRAGGAELTVPVLVMPGQADGVVTLPLGYGRERAGRIGDGVGVNAYALRGTDGPARLEKAGGTHPLVRTQDHHSMEGRPLAREANLEHYREEPHFAREMVEHPPLETLYVDREYDHTEGHQWGMSIDLNVCMGCNACMVACQSENNVAIVGKDEVARGREMHWLRVDRYWVGEPEAPQAAHQPVPCQQCENAPCEAVCPVNATSHSDDGLNQMTYNRCVGTRYCNNNCPYKVRRFNYFNWNGGVTEVEKMSKNPDVTVRGRGVMEKCTYCVQRINRARLTAKNAGREVRDGEIATACQQVCPTGAVVFGDINDPASRVSAHRSEDRSYAMLAELNVRPRTTYLARIRNPHPELEHA